MTTATTQRRYPSHNWDYKATSTMVNGIRVIYYTNGDSQGVEMYKGQNYIVGDSSRSWSRVYSLETYPKKYNNVVQELIKVHNNTQWSNESYVNNN